MERARDEEDGEDDIIEVGLEKVNDLGGDWDKQVVEEGSVNSRSVQIIDDLG